MSKRILRRKEVQLLTGLSRSSIYAKAADGTFPPQVKISARSVGWIESEVLAWLEEAISASRAS